MSGFLLHPFLLFSSGFAGTNVLLTSGDAQSGTDAILLSGDAQSGTDRLLLSGDAQGSDKDIAGLTAASALSSGNSGHLLQGGNSREFTLSQMNDYARANFFRGCRVYSTVQVTGFTLTAKAMEWDTEAYDTEGWHDNVTNNTRITVDATGIYDVKAQWGVESSPSQSYDGIILELLVNGTTYIGRNWQFGTNSVNTENAYQVTSGPIQLSASDYIELFVRVTPSTDAGTGSNYCWMAVRRLQ